MLHAEADVMHLKRDRQSSKTSFLGVMSPTGTAGFQQFKPDMLHHIHKLEFQADVKHCLLLQLHCLNRCALYPNRMQINGFPGSEVLHSCTSISADVPPQLANLCSETVQSVLKTPPPPFTSCKMLALFSPFGG